MLTIIDFLRLDSVSVLDLPARKLSKVIPISDLVQRIALSKDEHWLFVTDGKSNNIVLVDTTADTITNHRRGRNTLFSAFVPRWPLAARG